MSKNHPSITSTFFNLREFWKITQKKDHFAHSTRM